MGFRSYPRGAGVAAVPAHRLRIVPVDIEWTLKYGSRAQRRRLARHLKREVKSQSLQDSKK